MSTPTTNLPVSLHLHAAGFAGGRAFLPVPSSTHCPAPMHCLQYARTVLFSGRPADPDLALKKFLLLYSGSGTIEYGNVQVVPL